MLFWLRKTWNDPSVQLGELIGATKKLPIRLLKNGQL
jgi:hypothetical protein